MIHDLKPYPAYKDSGVPWLGQVPKHWEVVPNRALFDEVKERNSADEQLLSVTISKGVILQADLLTNSSKKDSSNEDKTNYKLVLPGDITYNKMRAWQGAVGVSKYRGIVSPAYVVVRPRGEQNVNYFHYLLRTPAFAKEAERWSYGITSDQWSLRPEHFKMIYCSLPPTEEQSAVIRYLDYMDHRIRRYIHAKQKLIKLLEEQKQAIIHRFVTRGLDPNVKLKPSGVEWLGDVPEHWNVKKLKNLTTKIVDGTHFTPTYVDEGIPFLRVTDIQSTNLNLSALRKIPEEEHIQLNKRCNPNKGDILLSKNGTIGITKVVDWDFPFSIFVSLCLIKPIKSLIDSYFVSLVFEGGVLKHQLNEITKTTSVTNLHLEKINELIVPVPPLEEQIQILKNVTKDLEAIGIAIEHNYIEIALLREYRTRLIADVVTGKLDVREAAASLPEEVEEPEVLEDEMGEGEGLDDEQATEFEEEDGV